LKKKQDIMNKIKKVVKGHPGAIPFAFLFGSFAEGKQTSLSDIDIAVYFHGIIEEEKLEIEQKISLLFDEPVHLLRLEDDDISPQVRLNAVSGAAIIPPDIDLLNDFILSIIHRAYEYQYLLERLERAA